MREKIFLSPKFVAGLAQLLLTLAFLYVFAISQISAQANSTINFQGKIVDVTDGTNLVSTSTTCLVVGVTNDTCDFRVNIYDAPAAGTLLFQETHSNVEIENTNGVFNLSLNSVCNDWTGGCAGSGIVWGNDPTIYIEIEFDPNGDGDFAEGEVFSRKLLQSVPYAYYADNAGSIGGLGANGLVQLQPTTAQTAANSTSLIWLNETGGGTPNLLELEVGGIDMFVIENDGSTSIGTSTNTAYLTIAGSTTSQASMRLVSSGGIDPTSANSGDLWWNGTNLYFNNGASNIDILGLNSELFIDSGAQTYMTSTTDDFVIGGSTVANSVFSIDVSTGEYFLGSNGLVNSELVFENANGSIARIGYNVNNNFNIYNGTNDARVSINKAIAEYELDVVGTIQVSEDILTDTVTTDDSTTSDITEDVTTRVENWFRQKVDGTGFVTVTEAVMDSSNNIYITGNFTGTVDMGAGSWTAGGTSDYFIIKYNSSGTYQWADREDAGTGNAFGLGVAVDTGGNVYISGTFTGAVTFITPTSLSATSNDYFIIKYNSSGTPQWVDREDAGTGLAVAQSVAVDSNTGDVYVAGYFSTAAVTFITPTSLTPSSNDYFLIKYNSSGTPQWVDREDAGTSANVQAFGVAVDSAGDVYVVGQFQTAATTFITPTALTPTAIDYFIIKYNSSGTPQWVDREDGGSGSVTPTGITIDGSDNIYVFGTYLTAAVTFISPNSLTPTGNDYFIIKYNTSGTPQWAIDESNGTGNSTLNQVAVGASGQVFACGTFDGAIDFGDGNGVQSATGDNFVFITYNSSGVIQSTQTEVGGAGDSSCYLADDVSSTTMIIAGQFGISSVDFLGGSKTPPGVGSYDFFAFSQTTTTNNVIIDTIVTSYLYTGSDIGTYANAFANIYTFGLVARGAVTFETIVNVQGDILATTGTADYGDSTTISATDDVGRHSEIILGSNGIPFIAAFKATGTQLQTISCNNIDCTSPTITNFSGTGGPVGDNEITVLLRSSGNPIVAHYETTGQDLDAIDCTNSSCSAGTPRGIDVTAAGLQSTGWINPLNGFPVFSQSVTVNTVLVGNTCSNILCSVVGTRYVVGTNQTGNEGQHPSAVVRSNGLPIIFTMDEDDGELEVINCTSESCNAFEATRVIDAGGDGAGGVLVGEHVEAAIGSSGYPIAVYRDVTNQSIKFVRCLDISCSTYDIRLLIDDVNDLGVNQLGIALKGNGSPVVSYHDDTEGTLNVYECASSECASGVSYQLTDGVDDEGEFSSIVRVPGSTDRFLISYYNRTDGDLMLFDYNKTYTGGVNLGSSTNYFSNLYTANIYSKNATISNFDVAEEYKVEDESIEAGDVVRFKKDSTDKLVVERTDKAYDGEAIGVISTEPGLYLKNWEENDGRGRPVALVGRVPVKVTDENGKIKRGDYLVASNTPGYAMKATEGGVIIGRAMEDFGTEGDSTLVAEQLQTNQEIVDTQVSALEDANKLTDEQVTSATAYLNETTVTVEEPTILTNSAKGRIMMYVDLGYIDDKVFGVKEEVTNSINILSYGMENGDNLFELIEEVDRSELKINAEVVIKKSLAAERYRSTGGDFIVEVAGAGGFKIIGEGDEVLFGVDSKGKISIREGEGGSIGNVEMKIGEKELRVLNSSVTNSSKIFIQPNKPVRYGVKDQVGGDGFTIEIPDPLEEDIKFNYWIIN